MAVSTQASDIVWRMEQARKVLHFRREEVRTTTAKIKKLREDLKMYEDALPTHVDKLTKAEEEFALRVSGYRDAGTSWLAVKAVEPEVKV
jgi:chromosome segregation ATPase